METNTLERDRLSGAVILEQPAYDQQLLSNIEIYLRRELSTWSSDLALEYRSDQPRLAVSAAGGLSAAVTSLLEGRIGPQRFAILGATDSLTLYVSTTKSTRMPAGNTIGIEGFTPLRGRRDDSVLRGLILLLAEDSYVRYARLCLTEEYESKNLIKTVSETSAVGTDLGKHLPGVYWVNYFGYRYLSLPAFRSLLSASGDFAVSRVGPGIFLQLAESPEMWRSERYRRAEAEVRSILGDSVFDRTRTSTVYTAPDFRISKSAP